MKFTSIFFTTSGSILEIYPFLSKSIAFCLSFQSIKNLKNLQKFWQNALPHLERRNRIVIGKSCKILDLIVKNPNLFQKKPWLFSTNPRDFCTKPWFIFLTKRRIFTKSAPFHPRFSQNPWFHTLFHQNLAVFTLSENRVDANNWRHGEKYAILEALVRGVKSMPILHSELIRQRDVEKHKSFE